MKKILITGVAGFIGYHVARRFLQEGVEVVGVDSLTPYYSIDLKLARVKQLQQQGVLFYEEDICHTTFMFRLLCEHRIQHVIHLAAQAGVRYAEKNPMAYVHSNLEGWVSLLEAAKQAGVERIVYASSSSVYQNQEHRPYQEIDIADTPNNLYAASKRCNELIAHVYHRYGLETVGVRLFTVYGPWGRPDMAYYRFTENMSKQQPITLFNGAKMLRDFTYIDDIVEGIVLAMRSKCSNEIFNLGFGSPRSVWDMIRHLEKRLECTGTYHHDTTEGEAEVTFADITKAKEVLGYHPSVSLEEGLDRFIEWYQAFHRDVLTKQMHPATSR